jgi:hypothetical protein
MPLTFDQIDEMIAYDPETGSFTWKMAPNRRTKAGTEAGTFKGVRMKNGVQMHYKYIHVLNHQTPAARVAWLLTHREWPKGNLLFKDENPRNLRIDNLKEADFPTIRSVKSDRRHYKMTSEAMRHYGLKRMYGISPEIYSIMLVAQNGVCAICKQPETAKSSWGTSKELSVDHNHVTGEIRGLLCSRCNHMIGHCRENREYLLAGVEYLDKHSGKKREPPTLTIVPTEEPN